MIKRILLVILTVSYLMSPAYANPLDAYIQNLTLAGNDYASGKISPSELVCKTKEIQFLMQNDRSVTEFISSNDIIEIKKMYEVTFNESDRGYENLLGEPETEKYLKSKVMSYVSDYKKIPTSVVIYYNIREQNAIAIFLKVQEDGKRKYFTVDMTPPLYERVPAKGCADISKKSHIYPENSPLNAYMQNLTVAGSDYVSGKVGSDELLCKVVETEYIINRDHSAIEFVSSRDNSEIKDMYEVTLNEFDWEYGDENPVKKEVRDYVWGIERIPMQLSIFYDLQGDKPVVIYLTIQSGREKKSIDVDMYPAPYGRFTNERVSFGEKCLEKYLKPKALNALENAQIVIASAKNSGIDTAGAEEHLENSKNFFEEGKYMLSETYASWALDIAESSKKLSDYWSLSDEEKIKLIQDKFSNSSKEKINRSEVASEGTIENNVAVGSNVQFNMFLGSESNSIYSYTQVTDVNNKTITRYENQLVGDYDLYASIDAMLFHELTLMGEAKSSPFSFGKRIGIGLVKGEIKIKPIWKFYKILSMLKAMGGSEGEFTKDLTSEIS